MTRIRLMILTAALLPLGAVAQPQRQAVRDVIRPLPDGCIRLTNFFENDIVNSEQHWNKDVLLAMTQYYWHVDRDPAVLKAMTDEANSILQQVGDPPKADITQQGWSHNGIESSCLLEPMMRLYQITGDGRYLDFARYICLGQRMGRQAHLHMDAREEIVPEKVI